MTLPGEVTPFWNPASLADALEQSVVAPVFCVTVTCGKFEPSWIETTPGTRYTVAQVDEVWAVKVDGVALTLVASTAAVAATPATWFWGSGILSVHLTGNADPTNPTSGITQTFLKYRFSDGPTDVGGYWWEPRLVDLPSLASRIPTDFKGVVQIGGGTLTLANEDDFFQSRLNQNWDAGETVIQMGVAGLPWADFVTLSTFANYAPSLDDKRFTLQVKESKATTDASFPVELYNTTEFPLLLPDDVGRAKQIAYGFIRDVNPVCIDQAAIEFQVASHAIFSFEAVRVYDQTLNVWNEVAFGSTDTTNARFTLDSATWQIGVRVAVDFYGRKDGSGFTMTNPAEVAEDLLTLAGYTVDGTANDIARDYLRMGTIGTTTTPSDLRSVFLYLDQPVNVLQKVEEIGFNCRCYLTSTAEGLLYFRPWRTYRVSTIPRVTDIDCLTPGLKRDTQPPMNGSKATQIVVNFAQFVSRGSQSTVQATSDLSKYTRNRSAAVVKTFESLLWNQNDANYLAQSLMAEEQFDSVTYSLKLKWRPFTWLPGDHISFSSDTQALDVLAEILEVRLNLTARSVDLKLGNLRGFDQATGFWSDVGELTPDGSSMVWANDSQKNYRRHQSGFWHNTLDQVVAVTTDSTNWSVSRWI